MSTPVEELQEELIGKQLYREWIGEPPNAAELEVARRLESEGEGGRS